MGGIAKLPVDSKHMYVFICRFMGLLIFLISVSFHYLSISGTKFSRF